MTGAGQLHGRTVQAQTVGLLHLLSRAAARESDLSTQIVRGGAAVTALCYGSAGTARDEICSLEPVKGTISKASLTIGIEIDRAIMARGVRQRIVIAQSVQSRADRESIAELADAGEVRYHPEVPLRLLVHDRRRAFVAVDPSNTTAGAYVTESAPFVALAMDLFESLWTASGSPVLSGEHEADETRPDKRMLVLQGLSEGLTDEALARRLDVSTRTIRRILSDLQRDFGTTSRFQLGLMLAEVGLACEPRRR